MKNLKSLVLVALFAVSLSSCYTTEHTVGAGAKGNSVEAKGQWFALFGLVPINDVDSKEMAAGATDYTIKTSHTFLDGVISYFTSIVTITKKTVEVSK